MTGTAFNISMVFRADVSEAKAGVTEVTGGMRQVTAEAGKASTALAKEAAEFERLAQAASKAARSQQDLVAAEKTAQSARAQTLIAPLAMPAQAAPIAAIWRQSETAAESLRGTVAGLSVSVGQQAQDMIAASQASRAYQAALDDVRASFNPLFAASRQYEQQLERIAEAERIGAISAREAAQARARAANIISPTIHPSQSHSDRVSSANTANIAAQGFDIGVTASMGMNPMMIGMQQGTQLVQVMQQMGGGKTALQGIAAGFASLLNPMSLATIGIVAFGAAGIQALMSLGGEARSFDDAMTDLQASVDAYAKSSDRARLSSAALRAEFGSVSDIAKQLLEDMAALDRRTAERDASAVVRGLAGKNNLALKDPEGEADDLRSFFGLSTWKGESWDLARGVRNAYLDANRAEGLDAQIAAVQNLKDAWIAASEAADGISKGEDEGLKNIQAALDQLTTLKGKNENAAGNARADEMVRQLQQRVTLERVALKYGQDSAEYRAAEQQQLRANTVLELQNLGLTEQDGQAKKVLAELASGYFAREATAAKARQDAQRDYLQGQDDQIAAMAREVSLIGATREEQARVNALAEADLEIRRRGLSIRDAEAVRAKAIAKAEAEITLERQKATRALQVAALGDAYDAQISLTRDPVSRANLEFQREYSAQIADGQGHELAYANAIRVRARAMSEATTGTQTQIADMLDEVAARQRIAAQVAAGTIGAADANRLLREELELRPLIAAAARAEGAEKAKLLDLIEGMRLAYAAVAAEDRRTSQNDYLRGQAERTRQLQLELALVGQTAETRARILSMVQAEQDIRQLGLTGVAADEVRQREAMNVGLAQTIEAQADAWQLFQSAGESAIDAVLDKLRKGDIKGALADMLGEIEKGLFELSVTNPLKNLILGGNRGTMDDLGGWAGLWDRITGKAPALDEKAIIGAAVAPVQSMTVTAANVVLTGNLSGIGAGIANLTQSAAANANAAPLSYGSLPGSSDVQAQVWSFFAAKGLAPHQIAAIMGNASAESAFNPLAVGDGGTSFGLFQHHAGRGQGLLGAVGGTGGLGDVQAQLQYVWQELMTTEVAAMRRLMSSTDVRGATEAWVSYERPAGYSAGNPAGSMHFDKRLAAAEAALTTFGASAQQAVAPVGQMGVTAKTATGQLGEMGAGMGNFGGALQQILGAAVSGDKNGALGGLLSWGLGALTSVLPGFAGGGDHRGGWRIVGENGPELEATGASRIFTAAQTRDIFSSRGAIGGGNAGAQPAAPAPGKMEVFISLTGARGDHEIATMVESSVKTAIEAYDRRALPGRVNAVLKDMRMTG